MPRKKIDREADMLSYFETEPLPQVSLMARLIRGVLVRRQEAEATKAAVPVKKVVRRRVRSKPVVTASPMNPAPIGTLDERQVTGEQPPRPRRRRRMRADSQPPVSEATPIVPLASEVGEDVPQSYEGN